MITSQDSSSASNLIVNAILGSVSVINVVLLFLVQPLGSFKLQAFCIFFGSLATILYAANTSRKVFIRSYIALALVFINSCVIGFLFELNPAPVYIFLPSFVVCIFILKDRAMIRAASLIHLLAVIVCYVRGEGQYEISILPGLVLTALIVSFVVASIIKRSVNENYFFSVKRLEKQLEQKRADIKKKTHNLQDQAKELNESRSRLETQIAENQQRVVHLKAVNEELGLLAKAASRDLKNPLRTIGASIDQLGKRLHKIGQDEGVIEYLHYVSDGASRMNAMVDDLLQYCDSSARRQPCQVSTAQVLEVIESNLSDLFVREGAHLIVDRNMPTISGYRTGVLQLFQNLISNGIKFRRPGVVPTCRVGFTQNANEICFYVRDNGIGIPSNRVGDVFGLFTRLHERGNYEGTGIGLAICRRIVLSAGGKIWAESQQGEGTTFYFTWPISTETVAVQAADMPNAVAA